MRKTTFLRSCFLSIISFSFAATTNAAEPSIALQSGQTVNFSLAASGYTRDFFIDVLPGDRQLKIEFTGAPSTNDVDLIVRYGSPFPELTTSNPGFVDYAVEFAHYRSISGEANESLVVNEHAGQPIRPGRWYIALINFGASGNSNINLTATRSQNPLPQLQLELAFDDVSGGCDISGWTDASARSPVGGNNATTLGNQRRNAMIEAARILQQNFTAAAPIRLQVCWSNELSNTTLAAAGPRGFFIGSNDFLPQNNTIFAGAPSARLNGTKYCGIQGGSCNDSAVRASFNFKVDGPEVLGSNGYWYGITPKPSNSQDADFITVAMHEISHGLGFISLVNTDPDSVAERGAVGAKPSGFDDIFSANLSVWQNFGASAIPYMNLTDEQRAAALVSNNFLRWSGAEALTSEFNSLRTQDAPVNMPQMFAPATLTPGSTQSHIGAFHNPTLMFASVTTSIRELGLALPMLNAVGWSNAVTTAPVAPTVLDGLYLDAKHPGHGLDFQKVPGTTNIYTLIFYSYDVNGNPEWYLATGPVIDGVFMPAANELGDSISKYKYSATEPHQIVQASNGPNGAKNSVRIDFYQPRNNDICRPVAGESVAILSFSIDADRNQTWCVQPLLPTSLRPTARDFTGTWFAGSDSGWGFAFGSFGTNDLFSALFYPDAEGNGRWAYALNNASNTNSAQLFQRKGYCRSCPPPASALANPAQFEDTPVGSISYTLIQSSTNASAGNKASFSANYLGNPAGTPPFTRTNTPIILLSGPSAN